ncbi:MAG TPA: lactate utilization protein C [Rubrobacteraceae bacterium]|nr:lactate utilization protein C [Rubrobacteraceae bacterium]
MATAKETILWRIRRATRDVPENERPEDVAVERGYRKEGEASREEIVARFAERAAEYKAAVRRVSESELPGAIAEALKQRGVEKLVIPPNLPGEWIPGGVETLRDAARPRLTNEELDGSDGVLTGCALAIAQTGTIVLDAGAAQGRRALTLLPDYHLCVVREDQIVGLVPEAFAGLEDTVRYERRAVTFISGPSATSDIELNRVEGVHGPRTLEVLISGE